MSAGISWLDMKLGARMLIKHPAVALVGGLGLAVAVALSAGFFSFMRATIYPVLPLDEGHRIVAVENRDVTLNDEERRSLHDFHEWRSELRLITDLAAFRRVTRNAAAPGAPPEAVQVAEMTASGFRVARVPALLGRHLLPEDEADGAPHVVVIGYNVWQNRFGGAADITQREMRFGGVPHTIVGVMPEGFAFPENDDHWTPLRAKPEVFDRRDGPAIFIFGRLAPGVTMRQAQTELTVLGNRAAAAHPETHANLRPMVMPYTHSLTDVQGITLWEVAQMQFMMTLLLIVVAFNVAVLVYARTAARRREIAVRSALGASRGRIMSQLFAEALVLALLASAVGLWIAQFGIVLAHGIIAAEMDAGVPFWTDYSLTLETVLFTLGLAILTAVITGLAPALPATGRTAPHDLRSTIASGGGLGRTWTALIVGQVAVAVAALPVALAVGWQEIDRGATRLAFPAEDFVVAGIALDPAAAAAASDPVQAQAHFGRHLTELLRRLSEDDAVVNVSFRGQLPGHTDRVAVEGVPAPPTSPPGHRVVSAGVGHDVFELFGLRLLAGRGLVPADAAAEGSAVVVTAAFVEQVLGGGTALGRRLRFVTPEEERGAAGVAAPKWFEIVGVIEDMYVNTSDAGQVPPMVAYALTPNQLSSATIVVRTRPGMPAADVSLRVREHAAAIDAALRLGTVRSLDTENAQQQAIVRLIALVVTLVLASVLLLSGAGVYALTSFTVTQRRREIGIRSALGAQPAQVLRTVFSRAAAQTGGGVLVGAGVAALLDISAGGSLLAGRGTVILPGLALAVMAVGLLAALGPARQGLRIPPTEALRADT